MLKRTLAPFVVTMAFWASGLPAFADISAVGEGESVGSWAQRFQLTIPSLDDTFDTFEVFLVTPGVTFKSPGIKDFAFGGDWAGQVINPGYILAQGQPVGYLQFTVLFTPDKGDPLQVDWLQYTNGELVYSGFSQWSGTRWTYGSDCCCEPQEYDRSPVPEPASVAMLGGGLLALSVALSRRRSRGADVPGKPALKGT